MKTVQDVLDHMNGQTKATKERSFRGRENLNFTIDNYPEAVISNEHYVDIIKPVEDYILSLSPAITQFNDVFYSAWVLNLLRDTGAVAYLQLFDPKILDEQLIKAVILALQFAGTENAIVEITKALFKDSYISSEFTQTGDLEVTFTVNRKIDNPAITTEDPTKAVVTDDGKAIKTALNVTTTEQYAPFLGSLFADGVKATVVINEVI